MTMTTSSASAKKTGSFNPPCIGLFGTCGTSTWRREFIAAYDNLAIGYYNPQVEEWKPELAHLEARHLVEDDIVLFPVTAQTYGTGSLAETGFSILQVLSSVKNTQSHRNVIVYIDPGLDTELVTKNPVAAKESIRARALVAAHLDQIQDPNVYVVDSMREMLMLSIKLYPAVAAMRQANEAVLAAQHLLNDVRQKHSQAFLVNQLHP